MNLYKWFKKRRPKDKELINVNPEIIKKCLTLSLKYSLIYSDCEALIYPFISMIYRIGDWTPIPKVKFVGVVSRYGIDVHRYESYKLDEVTSAVEYCLNITHKDEIN